MRLLLATILAAFLLVALAPAAQAICADVRNADGDCQTTDIRIIVAECGLIVGACALNCRGLYVGPCGDEELDVRAMVLP